MTRKKPLPLLLFAAVAVALVAVVIAGCGGGEDQATAASSGMSSASTVNASDAGDLGKVLVDSQGRTVYLFQKDTGSMSTCSGECARDWPPVTTSGKPTAGDGVTASMLGTTKRSDGTTQVTYNGHPLYRYAGDANAGDTNGQGLNTFGALWYVLSPAGNEVTSSAGSSSGSGGSTSPY